MDKTQEEYFKNRSLAKGSAGWILLAGLGVSYVISGDFSGWNLGLLKGGWGGLLIAFILMGLMYLTMVFGLAEMSSAMPSAGAGYGFARRALGRIGGYITGIAILIEYAIAPAAIAVFIGGYVESLGLFGIKNGWPIFLVFYLIFVGIHIHGVGEALKLMFGITAIAVLALLIFIFAMLPHFNVNNLFNIQPITSTFGASSFLPHGIPGAMSALVFGIWFFLAVEGVPLAAEEANNPKKDMPRGIIVAMIVLVISGFSVLLLAAGGAGSKVIGNSGAPLVDALKAIGDKNIATFVNYAGLAGLIASFFSIIYAYSRQLFALSRAGYLPKFLSVTSKQKTPVWALVVPGSIGFLLASYLQVTAGTTFAGDKLIDIAVFGATVSYALLNLSHIILRFKEPNMPRVYQTPGGIITTGLSFLLSLIAIVATFTVDIQAASIATAVLFTFILYYLLYSSKHLVAGAPEEEFALLQEAESDLK